MDSNNNFGFLHRLPTELNTTLNSHLTEITIDVQYMIYDGDLSSFYLTEIKINVYGNDIICDLHTSPIYLNSIAEIEVGVTTNWSWANQYNTIHYHNNKLTLYLKEHTIILSEVVSSMLINKCKEILNTSKIEKV